MTVARMWLVCSFIVLVLLTCVDELFVSSSLSFSDFSRDGMHWGNQSDYHQLIKSIGPMSDVDKSMAQSNHSFNIMVLPVLDKDNRKAACFLDRQRVLIPHCLSNKVIMNDKLSKPRQAIMRLEFSSREGTSLCTGFRFKPKLWESIHLQGLIILTSGHCTFDTALGTYRNSVIVSPAGYDPVKLTKGNNVWFYSARARLHAKHLERLTQDWGFIFVSSDHYAMRRLNKIPHLEWEPDQNAHDQVITVAGFPGTPPLYTSGPFDKQTMPQGLYWSSSRAEVRKKEDRKDPGDLEDRDDVANDIGMIAYSAFTSRGHSGGPVWIEVRKSIKVVGVHQGWNDDADNGEYKLAVSIDSFADEMKKKIGALINIKEKNTEVIPVDNRRKRKRGE